MGKPKWTLRSGSGTTSAAIAGRLCICAIHKESSTISITTIGISTGSTFGETPRAWETNKRTINLPVGSLPGIWGLAQMTVEDKAQNILRSDFTETIRFEVIDPDSQVTAFAIPQALLKVSGDEQSAPAGEALPAPFVVSVLDQNKGAYPGAPVTFKVIGGQGTLSVETTATDSTGQAATTLTLGRKPGINTVEVIVAGLLPVTFTAEGTGVPHRLTRITGDEQTGPAGRTLSAPFIVSVLDQNEEAYPGALVTFEVTGGQGSLSVESATTDSTGKAFTTLTLGDEPGLNTVDAVVAGLAPVTFTARGARIRVYPGFSTPKRKYGKHLSPCCSSEYMTRP